VGCLRYVKQGVNQKFSPDGLPELLSYADGRRAAQRKGLFEIMA
jgi:hypothetical protein